MYLILSHSTDASYMTSWSSLLSYIFGSYSCWKPANRPAEDCCFQYLLYTYFPLDICFYIAGNESKCFPFLHSTLPELKIRKATCVLPCWIELIFSNSSSDFSAWLLNYQKIAEIYSCVYDLDTSVSHFKLHLSSAMAIRFGSGWLLLKMFLM